MVILVYSNAVEKVSPMYRVETTCSENAAVSKQLDSQKRDIPKARCPHLMPSHSHSFLIVFHESGDGSSSGMLSCRFAD